MKLVEISQRPEILRSGERDLLVGVRVACLMCNIIGDYLDEEPIGVMCRLLKVALSDESERVGGRQL